jgi:NADH dehydrogenase (ubiquinone) 1 alpha subcomplex subunit 4
MYFLQSRPIPLVTTMRVANIMKRNYRKGPGSRAEQNRPPQGLTLASVKTHYSLLPLYASLGFAMTCVVLYCFRLATKPTDVSWRKEHEPWEHYRHQHIKIVNPTKGTDCIAPEYKN